MNKELKELLDKKDLLPGDIERILTFDEVKRIDSKNGAFAVILKDKEDYRLEELLEKEFLNSGEIAEVEEHEDVLEVEPCGNSGLHIGWKVLSIKVRTKEGIEDFTAYYK